MINSIIGKLKNKLGLFKRGLFGILQFDNPALPVGLPQTIIGRSVEGQEIACYQIGSGSRQVLIVGGIHGNEVGAIKLAFRLVFWLDEHKENYQAFTFFIIPCLNPDGYKLALSNPDYFRGGRVGRFNARQVDLNRNFPTPNFQTKSIWSRGKNYSENVEVSCGSDPLSEPETKALVDFILQHHIELYLALHNAGADVLGNNLPLAQKLAKAFSQASGYRLQSLEEWNRLGPTGTAKDWCEKQKINYLEIEGYYRWSSDWYNNETGITEVLKSL